MHPSSIHHSVEVFSVMYPSETFSRSCGVSEGYMTENTSKGKTWKEAKNRS